MAGKKLNDLQNRFTVKRPCLKETQAVYVCVAKRETICKIVLQ